MGDHYTKVAITLHWLIAIAIIALLGMGLSMGEDDLFPQDVRFKLFQIHKSLGLTVLVLSFLRLGWRLLHKPPSLPDHMPAWEKFAAKATHRVFYVLIIVIPLTGWGLVSTSSLGIPTFWFGLFEWPHIPGLADAANKAQLNDAFGETHEVLAYGLMVLLALHIGAALKHYFWDRDNVVTHMIPILKPLKK